MNKIDKKFIRLMLDRACAPDIADGGKGSGNFGHKGRPGQRGGSGSGGAGGSKMVTPKKSAAVLAERQNRLMAEAKEVKRDGIMSSTKPSPAETKAMQAKFLGNVSDKLKPYAKKMYEKAVKTEPKITSDICDIVNHVGATTFGLGFRLKKASDAADGRCRIEDKIQEIIQDYADNGKKISYEEATDQINDIVRYTVGSTADNLVDDFESVKAELEAKGYKCKEIKNKWDTYNEKKQYRGVNTTFESPEGVQFELQFHTAESLDCKENQHAQYEEWRNPDVTPERKAELGSIMYENAKSLTRPKNVERIPERWPAK